MYGSTCRATGGNALTPEFGLRAITYRKANDVLDKQHICQIDDLSSFPSSSSPE